MGGNSSQPKDYHLKYKSCEHNGEFFDTLKVGLFGSCIEASDLAGTPAKARSGNSSNNNLEGVIQDGAEMYRYFRDNGAEISCYDFNVPARPGHSLKTSVKKFVQCPGNNKVLYLSGHGAPTEGFCCGDGHYVNARQVLTWLSEVQFCGHITICIDTCFAAQWAKDMRANMRHHTDCMDGLKRAALKKRRRTYINVRAACLSYEKSLDTKQGGRYTQAIVHNLRREHAWTPSWASCESTGWGTKVLVARRPDGKSTLFPVGRSEPQTDAVADFVLNSAGSTWTVHAPSDRMKYVDI